MIVILFVSCLKPAPLSFIEFKIIKSNFLSESFFLAFCISSLVSSAKPTSTCLADLTSPKLLRISCVLTNSIFRLSVFFFILVVETTFGV